MNTLKLFLLLALITALYWPAPSPAQSDDVEINLDVLDRIVGPRPDPPPLLPKPMPAVPPQSVDQPISTMSADEELANTTTSSTANTAPPKPPKKPAFLSQDILAELAGAGEAQSKLIPEETSTPAQTVTKETSVPVASVEQEPITETIVIEPNRTPVEPYIAQDGSPPIPPKRPSVIHASKSFVQQALENFHASSDAPKDEPTKPTPKKVTTNKTAPTPLLDSDYLGQSLVNPTVQDILASIDPDEARAPATVPPAISNISENNMISLGFMPGVSSLPDDIKDELKSKTLSKAKEMGAARIEIVAYASAENGDPATAQRLSLARALEIREFLIENEIESSRINIKPMGENTDISPRDRVDIQFVE